MAKSTGGGRDHTKQQNADARNVLLASSAPDDQDNGASRKPVVIRVPSDLLKRIDHVAKRKGISRSAFIVSTVADFVHQDGE